MTQYNWSNMTDNITGIVSLTEHTNRVMTGGLLGIGILMGIVVVSFLAFLGRTNDPYRSFAGASAIAMVSAILMRAVDLVPDLAVFICILGAAAAIAFTWKYS